MSDNPKVVTLTSTDWVEICDAGTPICNEGQNTAYFAVDAVKPTYNKHTFSLKKGDKETPPGTGKVWGKVISSSLSASIGIID